MKHKVVITGLGMVSTYGISIEDFRKNPCPNIQYKTDWDIEDIGPQYYFEIPPFDIKEYFENLKAPYPLRYSQLAMLGCLDALRDANLLKDRYESMQTGLVVNTSLGANEAVEEYLNKLFKDGPRKVSPFMFSQTVSNVCLGYTAREFKLRGPSSLLFGESSINYGYDLIENGKAEIMICGGVDSIKDYVFGLQKKYLLECDKTDNVPIQENYERALKNKPFGNFLSIGEAASFIVLESLESAKKRKAPIYAELIDYFSVQDQDYKKFIFERNQGDYALSMQKAIERTSISIQDIDFVVGSAYSPSFFQNVELPAINDVFERKDLFYTSVKPFIGETYSSSTQASIILGASFLKNQNFKTNPMKDYYTTTSNISFVPQKQLKVAMINTRQVGGNNTSYILKKI